MKNAIVKAVVLCTLALSLLFVGVVSTGVVDADVAFLDEEYDGLYESGYEY